MYGSDYAALYGSEDFTRERYRELLRLARRTYTFRGYTDFEAGERFVLWRHDVDFSPHGARALARIEAEEGCRATYFLTLHSEFYNLLEREVSECVQEILSLGHEIGLHFDVHYYGIEDAAALDAALRRERELLESTFGVPVGAFSFHNTTDFTMACQDWTYGGMVNAYAAYFQREVGYCSDSNGYWRFRSLDDVLRDAADERLQVLTHPCWWTPEPMSPRARAYRCIEGRAAGTRRGYEEHFRRNPARENVCELRPLFSALDSVDRPFAEEVQALWLRGAYDLAFLALWRRLAQTGETGTHETGAVPDVRKAARAAGLDEVCAAETERVLEVLVGGGDAPHDLLHCAARLAQAIAVAEGGSEGDAVCAPLSAADAGAPE